MNKYLIIISILILIGCTNMRENNANIEWFFEDAKAPMALAIYNEDIEEITDLVESGTYDVNTRGNVEHGVWEYQWTFLNYAVAKHKLQSAKTLLDLGANINDLLIVSGGGHSNLNLASERGDETMMTFLIDNHIKVDHTIAPSPLYDLIVKHHHDTKLFDLLIENGTDINHPEYISGTRPIMTAYAINNHKLIDYLLARGADPLMTDTFGNSFASLLDMDINQNRNVITAKKYKQRLIEEYNIQYPIEVNYRKGIEQAIARYEKATVEEKKIMGPSGLERINGLRESLDTGVHNGIKID